MIDEGSKDELGQVRLAAWSRGNETISAVSG